MAASLSTDTILKLGMPFSKIMVMVEVTWVKKLKKYVIKWKNNTLVVREIREKVVLTSAVFSYEYQAV